MKIIWYIIGKYNRWFRKPLVCGTYFENDPKHFINKLTLKEEEEEESQTNTWAIYYSGHYCTENGKRNIDKLLFLNTSGSY